ncbi:MAG: SRPBCC family protein [Myxococcota bacterium]
MEIHTTISIHAPAEAAWAVLGEQFGDIGEWASAIASSSLDRPLSAGAVRTCQIYGFGPFRESTIKERLDVFQPAERRFQYTAFEGMPWFIASAVNRWSVEPRGADACEVRSHATVRLVWWLRPLGGWMRRSLQANVARITEELQHRVEHAAPHPNNTHRVQKMAAASH